MSAAFEAALGKLGLVDRSDPTTRAVANLIIEFAKVGERNPERLCALALQQLSNHRNLSVLRCVFQIGALSATVMAMAQRGLPEPRL
jgi:hypothetical protein